MQKSAVKSKQKTKSPAVGKHASTAKRKPDSPAVKKLKILVLRILPIAAVVLLAVYASGLFDAGDSLFVNNMKYAAGGFVYTGSLREGLFNGYGNIIFQDGSNYSGSFIDGRFSGEAVYAYGSDPDENRWSFEGVLHNGQTGNGAFHFGGSPSVILNRDEYADTFISPTWRYNGRYNERGQNIAGTFTYEDGAIYAGGFQNGLAGGEGVLFDAEGNTIYTGGFKNGSFDGHGEYFSPEGWTYEGNFAEGVFDGEGTVTIGENIVRGVWERGVQITRYE